MTSNSDTYGEGWASNYDSVFPPGPNADRVAEGLARYARRSGAETPTALELGVGTGRIAIPLARLGIRVHGIDLEPAMLEVLTGKQLPAELTAAVGDMTDASTFTSPDGISHYDLIYCVLATLTALPDGPAQRECLAAAASALNPGGRLVLEMPVPHELSTFDSANRRVRHMGVRDGGVWLETARHDPLRQVISMEQIVMSAAGTSVQPIHHRYVWPSELDLMAELAGLRLASRCDGWSGASFTPSTVLYVAEYVASTEAQYLRVQFSRARFHPFG